MRAFLRIFKEERGAAAVEYGLILALVFLAMVGGVVAMSGANTDNWNTVSSKFRGS